MNRPRRKKPRPALNLFESSSPLYMTDEEWQKLSPHLIFKTGEEGTARHKIDNLLLAFEIAEVERLNEPLYKKTLQAMAKVNQKLDRQLSAMQVIVLERVVKRQGKVRIIKHPHQALPSQIYLQKIRQITELFKAELANAISQLSNSDPSGPNTSLIHLLVEGLNEIVVEHSTGGALKRTYKRNGIGLVDAVLKLASERSKITIDSSMAVQAIKGLKKKAKKLEPIQTMGFNVDIPPEDLDHQDAKSILQRGLAIARQLRFCF